MANYSIASLLQPITQQDLPQLLSTLEAQEIYRHTHKELYILSKPILAKQTLVQHSSTWVQHRQNTSWEPATVMS